MDLSDNEIEVTKRLTEEQVEEKKRETFGKDNTTSTKSPRKEFSRNSEKNIRKEKVMEALYHTQRRHYTLMQNDLESMINKLNN